MGKVSTQTKLTATATTLTDGGSEEFGDEFTPMKDVDGVVPLTNHQCCCEMLRAHDARMIYNACVACAFTASTAKDDVSGCEAAILDLPSSLSQAGRRA